MRYCFALDLVDDKTKIEEYEQWHREIWPAIITSIKESGIYAMQIYRVYNRLFMIMETSNDFSFEKKAQRDEQNPVVQEWEKLMWDYQQSIPGTKAGEKWVLMHKIFDLNS